jgi:hypothetical protein
MNRFWISSALALMLVACSGTDGSGLLDDASSPQNDSSAPQEDAASPVDATPPQGDAVSPVDSGAPDVVTIVDAGPPDVHIGPQDSRIQCGPQTTCSAQSETCCWHMSNNNKPYECVTSVNSCAGTYDVPITCSTTDNCASQGNPTYQCCATGGNYGLTQQCEAYDVATVVACKSSCDFTDYQIGCSVQQQNCADNLQTCVVSKCTDPGATMCQ